MNRLRVLILCGWLAGFLFGAPPQPAQDEEPPQAPAVPQRLVVLEGFFLPGDSNSSRSGAVFDALAADYAGRAVVIEYDKDADISQDRQNYWYFSNRDVSPTLPFSMVDSGHATHAGFGSYTKSYNEHKAMIDAALTRAPLVDLLAVWERAGDAVRFTVRATNNSGATLDYNENKARIHVLVYEDKQVLYTGRFLRGYSNAPVIALKNGLQQTYTLTTDVLTGVNWSKLHFIALMDYSDPLRPSAYDQLQAVVAASIITITPPSLSFQAPLGGPDPAAQTISLGGPSSQSWISATTDSWLTLSPSSGDLPARPQAGISTRGMTAGVHTGKIKFNSGGAGQEVYVIASVGPVSWVYLPLAVR